LTRFSIAQSLQQEFLLSAIHQLLYDL